MTQDDPSDTDALVRNLENDDALRAEAAARAVKQGLPVAKAAAVYAVSEAAIRRAEGESGAD